MDFSLTLNNSNSTSSTLILIVIRMLYIKSMHNFEIPSPAMLQMPRSELNVNRMMTVGLANTDSLRTHLRTCILVLVTTLLFHYLALRPTSLLQITSISVSWTLDKSFSITNYFLTEMLSSQFITNPPKFLVHSILQCHCIFISSTPCLKKKLCQLNFCSLSVKYEPISIKIGITVPEKNP